MTKTNPKAAKATATSEAAAEVQAPDTPVVVAEVVENAAHKPEEAPECFDVRVLTPVTIAGARYAPNDVIEGLPLALIEAYAGSVDDHPDAVAYAHSIGAPVKHFEPEAA